MALGAGPSSILGLIVGHGLVLAGIGVGLGPLAAFGLTRFMAALLVGVSPTDPMTFIGVVVLLIGGACLACYIPARRALQVDPMDSLKGFNSQGISGLNTLIGILADFSQAP